MKNQGVCNAAPLELASFLGNQTSNGSNQTVWLSVVDELGELQEHPGGGATYVTQEEEVGEGFLEEVPAN